MSESLKTFLTHEFHSIKDVADFGQVGQATVRKAIEEGQLRVKRITPRLFRVRTVDALEWLGVALPSPIKDQQ
jgi:hypothetical protein